MPRVRIAAAAALLFLGAASAAQAQAGPCPRTRAGSTPEATYYYTDPIGSTSMGPKPDPFSAPGLCIDPLVVFHHGPHHHANGSADIHLYSSEANYISITFTIDPSLGTFDKNDPKHAFMAPGQVTWGDNVVTDNSLQVFLVSMGNRQYYPYYMRYLDLNHKSQKIEPGVHNH